MPQLTYLDIVNRILNAMDSDEVNSVSDTVESRQVGMIVEETFAHMVEMSEIGHKTATFKLEGLGDVNNPTKFRIPTGVSLVSNVVYDVKANGATRRTWAELTYLTPDQFLSLIDTRDESATNMQEVLDSTAGILLTIQNDKKPEYYTSFDDTYIVCDSYDNTVEATLQGSKTKCTGKKEITWAPTTPPTWVTLTAYSIGDVVKQNVGGTVYVYKADTAGTSTAASPDHLAGSSSLSTGAVAYGLFWSYVSKLADYTTDYFTPDLPSKNMLLLVEEAKAVCFDQIKQQPNASAVRRARQLKLKQNIEEQRIKDAKSTFGQGVNFGRK